MRNSSRKVWGGSLQPTPASGSRRPRPEGTCLGRRASLALVRGLGQAPLPASWALRALPSAWGLPPALPETLRTPTGPESACPDDTEEQPCPAGRLAELRVRQGLRALPGQHTRPTRSVAAAQACVWDSLCADHSPGWGAGRAAQMKGRINCPPVLVTPAMDAFWKVLWSRKTPLPRAPPAPGICGSRSTNLPLTLNAAARTLHRLTCRLTCIQARACRHPAGSSHTLTFVCITEALLHPMASHTPNPNPSQPSAHQQVGKPQRCGGLPRSFLGTLSASAPPTSGG